MPAAAVTRRPPPPGFFVFLKHGFLLPARHRGLFLPLLALTAALAAGLLLANFLAVQPLAAAVLLDANAISHAHRASAAYPGLVRKLKSDLRRLLLDVGACLLAAVLAGSAIKIVTVFAAVAAFSGTGRPTVLSSARGNLLGPVLTVAFGYVLQVACAAAIVALALLMVYLLEYSLLLLFLDLLLVLLASLFLVYLTVVCAVALVVSAAEPGRRGVAAVSRAWRLMERKNAQAVFYLVATCALGAAVSPVYTLALSWWQQQRPWSGVAAGVAYVVLLGAVEVFSVAALTAYYFECRDSKEEEEEMARHRYVKLPSGDQAHI